MATVQEKAICVLRFFATKSVIKMQHRYRTQYGKDPPSNNLVAAIETFTPQMLPNTWKEIDYRLDNLRAKERAHVEVV
jgi:hypothetical protein